MSYQVLLDGVDITSRVASTLMISIGEQIARTGSFVYYPSATPLLPTELIRKSVVINYLGSPILTGKVSTAVWNLGPRSYSITCSDLIQEVFEDSTETEILALVPFGTYSEARFGEREDGWRQAQDIMSTTPYDVHLANDGATIETAIWEAKTTPDRTLTADQILNDGAYTLELAGARDIITQRVIKVENRFSRWKMRKHKFGFNFYSGVFPGIGTTAPASFCDWLTNHTCPLPTREMIHSAAQGTNWTIHQRSWLTSVDEYEGISFKGLPSSQTDLCQNGTIFINPTESAANHVTSASWTGTRHWAQTITETYDITINAVGAQSTYGVVPQEDSVAEPQDADDSGFESGDGEEAGYWPIDVLGDYYQDQNDESLRTSVLNATIGVGLSALWASLRKNYVTVEVPLDPTLSLTETIRITTADIDTQGKVYRLEHQLDEDIHKSIVTIAVCRGGAGGPVVFPLPTPDQPDSTPGYAPPADSTTVGTHLGGCINLPVFDDDWDGFTANHVQELTLLYPNPNNVEGEPDLPPIEAVLVRPSCSAVGQPSEDQLYPQRFSITGPDIDDDSREEMTVSEPTTLDVYVPEDLLVLY